MQIIRILDFPSISLGIADGKDLVGLGPVFNSNFFFLSYFFFFYLFYILFLVIFSMFTITIPQKCLAVLYSSVPSIKTTWLMDDPFFTCHCQVASYKRAIVTEYLWTPYFKCRDIPSFLGIALGMSVHTCKALIFYCLYCS